jgi:3-oxoacyl-[acyl-carrier protein] reductase
MKIDLSNRNILVTGASRGIGKAIAEQLLKSGARVAAHYNTTPIKLTGLNNEQLNNLYPIKSDLANTEETAVLIDNVVVQLGHIDVLINNAGLALKS